VNGQPVKSNSELRNSIGLMRVGDKVEIGLLRDGKPLKVTAIIADTTATSADDARPKAFTRRSKAPRWPTHPMAAARW
jgi:hypothetical protein